MSNFQIGIQVIVEKDDAILLGLRKKSYGYKTWGLPGGHLKFGESFEEAAIREVQEETSLVVKGVRLFGVMNDPSLPRSHHVQIGLIATEWSGELWNPEPDSCECWEFHPINDLPEPLFSSSAPLIGLYVAEINNLRSPLARSRGDSANYNVHQAISFL
jgi:8-oxo-dGTP diphosphatase